jgi:hypothetical protein
MSLLDPFSHALAAVVAAAQVGLTSLGADPTAGYTWLLAIAAVVVAVRLALLPLVVHGVRLAHASASAQPHLRDLSERYRNRKDPESMRQFLEERRRITTEHGVPRLGCLPLLIQLPIWLSLYHLLAEVAGGASVGAMTPELVASLGAAAVLGVPLAERGYLGGGATHLAVVAGNGRDSGGPRLHHPEVRRRPQHLDRRAAGSRRTGPALHARLLGTRTDRGGWRRTACASLLLGLQLGVDLGTGSGHLKVVPHTRHSCRQSRAVKPAQRP